MSQQREIDHSPVASAQRYRRPEQAAAGWPVWTKVALPAVVILILGVLYAKYEVWAAPDPVWHDDYDQALAQARKENKFLLIFFNDRTTNAESEAMWSNIFSTKEFHYFAQKKCALLNADFSAPLERCARFKTLYARHKISGLPTVLFLNSFEHAGGQVVGYQKEPLNRWMKILDIYKSNPG